mmetsp:Transcript_15178/g.19222  ORF Transcript_15178/g.19222 Transcript_15178/m.19222 type:complete len:100 (+) Transcript_15178:840-1139(+)
MECTKCKYQFCWHCLDEFYTTYHYEYSNCPFRYCLLHSIEVACALLVLAKAVLVFDSVRIVFLFITNKVLVELAVQLEVIYLKKGVASLRSAKRKYQSH